MAYLRQTWLMLSHKFRAISWLFALIIIGRGTIAENKTIELLQVDPAYQIVERGQNHALFRGITSDSTGRKVTNQFVVLENGLHYFENGEWKPSEDIITPFADGAVADRGPVKTIFSPDLNSETVFDIQTDAGERIRGGVRAIQLTDTRSGRSTVLGTLKPSTHGEVVPPNFVVYRSGFNGIDADVVMAWHHNNISQNVVLKERPILPPGMDPSSTRIEIVTELVETPVPKVTSTRIQVKGKPDVQDDVTFGLGSMVAIRGKAFSVSGGKALELNGDQLLDENSLSVVKQLFQAEDGRQFVIESLGWEEIQPILRALPAQAQGKAHLDSPASISRSWPKRVAALAKKEPLKLASLPYQHTGFLVDLDLSGSASSQTFLSGTTYYIATSYYIANGVFQPGTVIKYGNNAWLLIYNSISCPGNGQTMPVLTSKDDDLYGDVVSGSGHNPTYSAAQALWSYYINGGVYVANMQIRWAKRGIQFDANPGMTYAPQVANSLFQQCQIGVYVNLPSTTLSISNIKQCGVITPISGGYWSGGGMISDCSNDSDSDLLPDDWELAHFGNLTQTGSGDPDADGRSNAEEALLDTDPLTSDDPFLPGSISNGQVLSGEQDVVFSSSTGESTHLGIGFYANGNLADSIIATQPSANTLHLHWDSIYVKPPGNQAFAIPANYHPTPAEVQLLRNAFGHGTSSTAGIISQPNQALVNALPQRLLEYYEQVSSAQIAKNFRNVQKGIGSVEANIFSIHTQWTRLNAVSKALGRLGKVLPVIGGIFVVSSQISMAETFRVDLQSYADDVRNDFDVTGSAAIVSGDCNNMAAGSGNIVLDYILR